MRNIKLRPISVILADLVNETENDINRYEKATRENLKTRIKTIEQNFLAFALLDEAGIDLSLSEYTNGSYYSLDLGYFARTRSGSRALADKVRQVRLALGCRLEQAGKSVGNGKLKHVKYILQPKDFPTIQVTYTRKIPAGASCKIVTQRSSYRSLVCENI